MTFRFKPPIWVLPLAIAGLVGLLGWWGNGRLKQAVDVQLKQELNATLDANVTALEIWTADQKKFAASLAEEPTVRQLANRILDAYGRARGNFTEDTNSIDLGTFLRPRLARLGYETAQLVNTNFIVVATSNRGRFGTGVPVSESHTNHFAELFATDQAVIISPFKPDMLVQRRLPRGGAFNNLLRTNRPALTNRPAPINRPRGRRGDVELMQVAAPIQGRVGASGALALIINPTNEFSRILSVARRGESGETYAFDQTGLLISQSRFDLQLKKIGLLSMTNTSSALNLRLIDPGGDMTEGFQPAETNFANAPLIHIVANALTDEAGVDLEPSRDYRGVPVVGAWRWLPQFGFGVATEMEAGEAFWLLRMLRLIFTLLFLLLVLCAVVLFVFSYVNFTSRQRLQAAELKLKQLGQYSLEEKIGAGSMGVVYRARHALMRRDTAVKLLLPQLASAAAIARFENEVRLTCRLAHPNTIQIYDYGHTPEGVFYYAMEFLTGLNLHQLVAEFGPQPEGRVINILTQVCNSLAEAHAAGLVHRDIKPSNVFLTDRGGVPDYVKVLDFGLVRQFQGADGKIKCDEGMAGTPWFMPPEAIENPAAVDPRSDIYSVGGLAYYLMTGRYVFDHDSADEVCQLQLTAKPVPPSRATTNPVSAELEEVILRCLEKDPALRPQSALELVALLLTSPCAADSTPETRAEWWRIFHGRKNFVPAETSSAEDSPMPGVNIDLAGRLE